jgi:hypothetical protein
MWYGLYSEKLYRVTLGSSLTDHLEVHLDHVRMSVVKGGNKTKVQSFIVLNAIKTIIVVVKSAFMFLLMH